MASAPSLQDPRDVNQQGWPWWPLLPLYPYGQRATLIRERVPGQIWTFEQLHGVWYVAVPIRMTVVKVAEGLLLYAPVAPTPDVLGALHRLEEQYGPVCSIVLPTTSGLEHKVPVPAMARAFPKATVWLSDGQWSFPLRLPSSWLGFPLGRTKVLGRDGFPHPEQLTWVALGPLDLGLGRFLEVACLDQATGTLLVTDALVSFTNTPPEVFSLDPTPLLFHARERGSDPLLDTAEQRSKGWKRILLFANFFRPASVHIPAWGPIRQDLWCPGNRQARAHFGLYPFRWSEDWEDQANQLLSRCAGAHRFTLAPVLERLVLVRAREQFIAWIQSLAALDGVKQWIGAHYDGLLPLQPESLATYAAAVEQQDWAPSEGSWHTLASIDRTLLRWKLVPAADRFRE
ncbi:MAG: DUF4336 domain-containing protein [Cyanobacteriota bacterium]|nr:DUF4336 domain-containing protein [Cyanobacteriota bacterium]